MKKNYPTIIWYSQEKQQGVVLIVALVFLVALTAVAAALMQNTTTDVKMAGASQEKSIVTQETVSEMERVIYNEYRKVDGTNEFANIIVGTVILPVTDPQTMTASAVNANQFDLDVSCPRSSSPTSGMKCSITRVQVNQVYGRDNNQTLEVNSGIAQQLLTGN